ncbi:MAG: hypothetical protein U1F43_33520 [Myxococcota bacterium]
MKPLFCLVASILALTSLGAAAHAENWNCQYQGSWTTNSTGNTGEFNWSVLWTATGGGWRMQGEYDDRYGHSILDGKCSTSECTFRQTYRSGQLAGKVYYWQGNYSDDHTRPGETVNRFTGTWGYSPDARDGGPWDAVAMCRVK